MLTLEMGLQLIGLTCEGWYRIEETKPGSLAGDKMLLSTDRSLIRNDEGGTFWNHHSPQKLPEISHWLTEAQVYIASNKS